MTTTQDTLCYHCCACAESLIAQDDDPLTVELAHDVHTVRDPDGGVWWPSEEAAAEIAASDDPGATAIRMCTTEPMRGEWRD